MLHVHADGEALARAAAGFVEEAMFGAIRERGCCRLFLAGGSTPKACYRLLAEDLPSWAWRHTGVWFGDERCVPPDDPRSNAAMARESLLDRVCPDELHLMDGTLPSDEAARAYAALLPEQADLILLGMGADGHTASLFPGTAALEATTLVAPGRAPVEPRSRITLTPPYLARARETMLLVSGEEKGEALLRVLAEEGDWRATPARLVRKGRILADRAAAARAMRELPMRVRGVDGAGGVLFEPQGG